VCVKDCGLHNKKYFVLPPGTLKFSMRIPFVDVPNDVALLMRLDAREKR